MAKHRRKKSKAPVDYGIVFTTAAVIAGRSLRSGECGRIGNTHHVGPLLAQRSYRSASLS